MFCFFFFFLPRGKARKPEQQLYIPRPRRLQQQQQQQYSLDNDEYISPYTLGENNDERGVTPTSPDDLYPHPFSTNPNNNNVNTPQQTGRKNTPRATCTARKTRREVEIYIPRAKRLMQQGGAPIDIDGLAEAGSLINCREPASPLDRLSGEYSADWTVGGCQDASIEGNRQGGKVGLQCLNVRNSRQSTTHRSPDGGRRGRRSKQREYQSPSSSDDSGSSERKVTLAPAPQTEERNRNRPCGRKNRNATQPNVAGDSVGTYAPDNVNKNAYVIPWCSEETSANASVQRCTNERQPNESVARGTSHKSTLVNESTKVCDKTNVAVSNPTRQQRRSPISSCDPNKLPCESKSGVNNAKSQSSSPHRPADQDSKQGIPSISSEATPSPSSLDNQQSTADPQCTAIPVDIPKEETDHYDSLSSKSPVYTSASGKRSPSTGCKEADNIAASKDSDDHCSVKNLLNKSKETLSNTDLDSSIDDVINEDTGTMVKAAKKSSSVQELTPLSQNGSQPPCAVDGEDEGADSWDALYDENGDCLDPAVMEEVSVL